MVTYLLHSKAILIIMYLLSVLAHVDTSPDFNASHVNPHIIEAYNGQPIKLGESQRILDPDVFPELNKVVGHTLMVTDGTSLLAPMIKQVLWK